MNLKNGLMAPQNFATHPTVERLRHTFQAGPWNTQTTTTSLYWRRLVLEYCFVTRTVPYLMDSRLSLDQLYLIKVRATSWLLQSFALFGYLKTLFLRPLKWHSAGSNGNPGIGLLLTMFIFDYKTRSILFNKTIFFAEVLLCQSQAHILLCCSSWKTNGPKLSKC